MIGCLIKGPAVQGFIVAIAVISVEAVSDAGRKRGAGNRQIERSARVERIIVSIRDARFRPEFSIGLFGDDVERSTGGVATLR